MASGREQESTMNSLPRQFPNDPHLPASGGDDVERIASANSTEEWWYLRIDGQVFGPAMRAQLEHFLRPPRLCKRMEVICTSQSSDWHVIGPDETLADVLQLVGISTHEEAEAQWSDQEDSRETSAAEKNGQAWVTIASWIKTHAGMIAIVVIMIIVNFGFYIASRDPHTREREILTQYESIWEEMHFYDPDTGDEWWSFVDNSLSELEPVLKELEQTADVAHPLRQNLLFAGRDHLVPLLKSGEPPAPDNPSAKVFERYLQILKKQLSSDTAAEQVATTQRKS